MKILTILFTTLFLMGCPNNDTATEEDVSVQTTEDAAAGDATTVSNTDATEDATTADTTASPEDAATEDAATEE